MSIIDKKVGEMNIWEFSLAILVVNLIVSIIVALLLSLIGKKN
jgi:hypothetical protein